MEQVLIVGGGITGALTARLLSRRLAGRAAVTLIDGQKFFQFKPRLVDALAYANFPERRVASSLPELASRFGYRFQQGWVTEVDRSNRMVTLMDNGRLSYDYLVLAIGSGPDYRDVPGAAQWSCAYNTFNDARALRQRALTLGRGSRIALVGAGLTGVELAGSMSRLVAGRGVALALIGATEELIFSLAPRARRLARRTLSRLGVELYLGQSVAEVTATAVALSSGKTLPQQLVIWTAGTKPNTLRAKPALPTDRRGYFLAQPTLQLDDRIFGGGDCVAVESEAVKGTPTAQRGRQMAFHISDGIQRLIAGKPPQPFAYQPLGSLLRIDGTALADLHWVQLRTPLLVPVRDILYRQRVSEVTGRWS